MKRHTCKHCGETFTSAYFRNLHEAENCDERETEGSA